MNDLDPNGDTGVQWPPYNTTTRATLQFNDGDVPLNITVDDARLAGMNELAFGSRLSACASRLTMHTPSRRV